MCLIQGGPKRKVGFCLNNLYMLRAEIKSSGSHWQTESNILMETCWVMIDRIVEREQESRSSAERWSISPINIYCTPSQQPILTVSVCVTGTAVEIPLTLYIGCWSPCGLILITSSGYSPLQEWDTDICKKFSPTCVHFFFWKQTSTHKFNPSVFVFQSVWLHMWLLSRSDHHQVMIFLLPSKHDIDLTDSISDPHV